MDPSDDQNTFFGLDLTGYFRGQLAVAGIDLTRFQRASKSAHHSTSGGSDDIVNGGSVRFLQFGWVDFVVLRYGPVHAENHRLRFARKMSNAKRSSTAFNGGFRDVNYITHAFLLATSRFAILLIRLMLNGLG
jgi:hypothetical protein